MQLILTGEASKNSKNLQGFICDSGGRSHNLTRSLRPLSARPTGMGVGMHDIASLTQGRSGAPAGARCILSS